MSYSDKKNKVIKEDKMKFIKLVCIAIFAAGIASCSSAPKIKTQVVHPPLADMKGIQTITVVPFELSYSPDSTGKRLANVLWSTIGASYSQDKFDTAQYFTGEVIRYLQNSGLYVVVLYSENLFPVNAPAK